MEYLLFAGEDYYPCGGADDLIGKFCSVESAVSAHDSSKFGTSGRWAHVLCLEDLRLVKQFNLGVWSDVENKDG